MAWCHDTVYSNNTGRGIPFDDLRMSSQVTCPTCKRSIEWSSENKWRPFCSERCKLIDLGAWASESHVIPGEVVIDIENRADPDSINE